MKENKMEVTELFLELSSEVRYNILKKLEPKSQKQSHIAKELGMTLPESHRQFERLSKVEMIAKDTKGLYSLTPFGYMFLKHLDSLEFLLQYKDYFQSHTLGDLPLKFEKRISDLTNCELVEGAFVLNEKMIKIASSGQYLRVISAHVPPDAFRQGLDSAVKTGKQVSIIYAKKYDNPKGVQRRVYKQNSPGFDITRHI